MKLAEWIEVHDSLSKTLRKAARVALGKDVAKVQHFVMSGIESKHVNVLVKVLTLSPSCRGRDHSGHLPLEAESKPVLFLVQKSVH